MKFFTQKSVFRSEDNSYYILSTIFERSNFFDVICGEYPFHATDFSSPPASFWFFNYSDDIANSDAQLISSYCFVIVNRAAFAIPAREEIYKEITTIDGEVMKRKENHNDKGKGWTWKYKYKYK